MLARRSVGISALAAVVLAAPGAQPAATAQSAVAAWGTTVSAPAGYLGTLDGVAAASPTDVWAVGADNPDQAGSQVLDQPYAEHWNGSAWTATAVAAPSLYGTHQAAALTGTTAVGPGNAWAVGDVSDLWSLDSQTLAYHWTGQAWSPTTTTDPAGSSGSNALLAVAARTGSDVWAAGYSGYPEASLVEHWNGTAWATVTAPNVGPLQAVAVNPSTVWAAGTGSIESYNGTRWTTLPTPPVTAGSSLFLHGLADNTSGLWAVGTTSTGDNDGYLYHSYAAVYNGTGWTVVPVPGLGLNGAAASGSVILAAASNNGVYQLTTAGTSQAVTPAPGTVYPDAITADPTGDAWAVGFTGTGSGQAPGIINAPGIGQGGIIVTTGVSNATVTWTGPVNHSGTTDTSGNFSVGGLPDGTYTVISSYGGCSPGVATVTVTAGAATPVNAQITC